jgi:hypothetical protein
MLSPVCEGAWSSVKQASSIRTRSAGAALTDVIVQLDSSLAILAGLKQRELHLGCGSKVSVKLVGICRT